MKGVLTFTIDLANINDLQVDSLRHAIQRAKQAHYTDLDMRIDGKNERIQADWLKYFVEQPVETSSGNATETKI